MYHEVRNRIAAHYVAAFTRDGSRAYIQNLDTSVGLHSWGQHALPVTVNDGGMAHTFVCSPHVGYIDYPREELSRFPNAAAVPALRAVITGTGKLLALSDMNRIVHINNWMMSTNLPVPLDTSLTARQTRLFSAKYPKHVLAMRSLTRRHSLALMEALEAAGWTLVPSRQVFLVDDVTRESFPRRDSKKDAKIWRQAAFSYEELVSLPAQDASRIAELYGMLYLEKYSRLNPAYTPRFVSMTHEIGMIRYLVLRDEAGIIQGFGGLYQFGAHATMPLIGYNTRIPQKHGLFRLAFHAGSLYAARYGLHFNMSSGATDYKRSRGATAEMEFTAFYLRHLTPLRRMPVAILRAIAQHIGMPILRKYNL